MTDQSPDASDKNTHFDGTAHLGVTEWLYLLGLLLLSIGINFLFDWKWALTVCGAVMLITAFYNDTH